MSLPLKWKFPGGKVSRDETPEQALMREIDEELGLAISIHEKLPDVIHYYSEKTVRLMLFVCAPASETITLRDHRSVVWCGADELSSLD
jgi:8-oxo-dGTP diphosphatase